MDMALISIVRETRRNRDENLSVQEGAGFEATRYGRLNHPVKHAPRLIGPILLKCGNIKAGQNDAEIHPLRLQSKLDGGDYLPGSVATRHLRACDPSSDR